MLHVYVSVYFIIDLKNLTEKSESEFREKVTRNILSALNVWILDIHMFPL